MTQTLGQRIKHRLIDLEMSQSALAKKLGYGKALPQTVSMWANDTCLPETRVLPALARALDCSIDWLLTGNESEADA
jgi:transcriptional regulator with XRE-family HTH domain